MVSKKVAEQEAAARAALAAAQQRANWVAIGGNPVGAQVLMNNAKQAVRKEFPLARRVWGP